jgi:hypothetical protein
VEVPLFLLRTVLVLMEQFILLSKLEDEGIEFLIVDLYPFQIEDLILKGVDNDVFLVIFCLG